MVHIQKTILKFMEHLSPELENLVNRETPERHLSQGQLLLFLTAHGANGRGPSNISTRGWGRAAGRAMGRRRPELSQDYSQRIREHIHPQKQLSGPSQTSAPRKSPHPNQCLPRAYVLCGTCRGLRAHGTSMNL